MTQINTTPGQLTYTDTLANGTSLFATRSWTDKSRHFNPLDYYTQAINVIDRTVRCTCPDFRRHVAKLECKPTLETPGCHCKHLKAAMRELGLDAETLLTVAEMEAARVPVNYEAVDGPPCPICGCGMTRCEDTLLCFDCDYEPPTAAVVVVTPPVAPPASGAKKFMKQFDGQRIMNRGQYRTVVEYGKAMAGVAR